MDLKGRNFLTLKDFTPEEITYLLDLSAELKEKKKKEIPWFLAFCKAADSSDTSGNRRAGVLLFWRVCQSGQCHA